MIKKLMVFFGHSSFFYPSKYKLMGMDTLAGSQFGQNVFICLVGRSLRKKKCFKRLLKEINFYLGSKFFPCRVDYFSTYFFVHKKANRVIEVVCPLKMASNYSERGTKQLLGLALLFVNLCEADIVVVQCYCGNIIDHYLLHL